jgi:hypothetical protein
MQTIEYNRFKLTGMALLSCVVMPIFGLVLMTSLNPFGVILGVVFLISGPIAGLAVLAKLVLGGAALAYNDRQVTLSTLWSSRTVPWSQVQSVSINRTTLKLWGLIPLNRIDHLEFQLSGGSFGTKKVSLAFSLMSLSVAEANDVIHKIDVIRSKAPQQAGVVPELIVDRVDYDPLLGAPRTETFDPDVVLARYLAAKQPAAAPALEQHGFSGQHPHSQPQKTPATSPTAPTRPVFGRKAA